MGDSMLQRAIACIQTGRNPLPETVRDYILEVLDRRHHKPRKTRGKFRAALNPVPALKKELDRVFSVFIRRRGESPEGFILCVTCGHVMTFQEAQAGHYQPRQDMNTRWDEKNVHPQCGACNGFRGGEQVKMAAYIDKTYGPGTADLLQAKARLPLKLDRHKLTLWIREYKRKIGEPDGASSRPEAASAEGPSP